MRSEKAVLVDKCLSLVNWRKRTRRFHRSPIIQYRWDRISTYFVNMSYTQHAHHILFSTSSVSRIDLFTIVKGPVHQ